MLKGPYRLRTWIRGHTPWWAINLGLFDKGKDCEQKGGWHDWVRFDDIIDVCRHCKATRPYSMERWKRWKEKYGVNDNFGLIPRGMGGSAETSRVGKITDCSSGSLKLPEGDQIRSVLEVPWCADKVKRWLTKQWGKMDVIFYLERVIESCGQVADQSRRYPETYIYVRRGDPIGTVSLVLDEFDDRLQFNPWICCLFVAGIHRGNGIGRNLVKYAESVATQNMEQDLFMTINNDSDCSPSGWEEIEVIQIGSKRTRIMRKSLLNID